MTAGERAPDDPQLHALLGIAFGYAGRGDAIEEVEKAVGLARRGNDPVGEAYFLHLLARVYVMTDNRPKAVDAIKEVLTKPYFLSPKWLTIDPTFDPLRHMPAFAALVAR